MATPEKEQTNIEQLQKLGKIFNTDNVITAKEIEQVLEGITAILASFNEDREKLNEETRQLVIETLEQMAESYDSVRTFVDEKTGEKTSDMAKVLKEARDFLEEVKKLTPAKGDKGDDADQEVIIEEVLARIKLPEYKAEIIDGESIVEKINAISLEGDDAEDYKIDASHIKNLDEYVRNVSGQVLSNYGGGNRMLSSLIDVDLTGLTKNSIGQYILATGGGGAVDSVNGQTGVVVLDTDDILEGVANLYYTDARFDTRFATKTTTDLAEGTNLYFTEARVRATPLTGLSIAGGTITSTDTVLSSLGALQNQINAVVGGVNYQGTWNATTNSPTIVSGVGTKGYYYVVSVAGSTSIDGISDWKLGDWIIFNGTTWQKVDNTDAVISVNGYTGAVVLALSDFGISASSTEINYLTGATSNIQSQLNAKQATISLTTTGTSGNATFVANVLNIPNYTYTLPTASTSVLGGVQVDGTTITISSGIISAATGGSGDVTGPASAINNNVVFFDGASGKLIKDSGLTLSGSNTGDQTITLTGDITGTGTGSFVTAIAAGVIVNADINASAAIALTKLAATTANRALVSDASGFIVPSATTDTEIGYLSGVTSSIQTQINTKVDAAGVRATTLTGLSITGSAITSADTVLSAFGKVQNQINALVGGVTYQGAWNASTNSPSLATGVGTKGYYYVVSVAGSTNLDGITDWKLGDWAIFNGTAWEKIDNTDAVISVNGFIGAVTITTAGTTNRITVTNGSTNPVIDIAATYVGQSSITTLGTITTGTWQGTTIADAYIASAATWNAKLGASDIGVTVQAYDVDLTAWAGKTAPSGTVVGTTDTQILSNKAITKRVVTTTDDATAVIDVTVTDVYELSAVANNTTFTLTGTPTDGQNFIIRYKDAGVSKTLTWTGFTPIGVTLPTATTAGKWGYVGVTYNSAAGQYHVTAVTTEI